MNRVALSPSPLASRRRALTLGAALALGGFGSLLGTPGCGGGAAASLPPAPPPPPPSASPLDVVGPTATGAAHVDAAKLRASAFWKTAWTVLQTTPMATRLTQTFAGCKFAPLDAVTELAAATGPEGDVFGITFAAADADVLACMNAVGGGETKPVTVGGLQGIGVDDQIAVIKDHVVFAGPKSAIEAIVKGGAGAPGARGPLAAKVDLTGAIARGEGELKNAPVKHVVFSFTNTDAAIGFDVTMTAADPAFADRASHLKEIMAAGAAKAGEDPETKAFLDSIEVTRSGDDVRIRTGVEGGSDAQSKYLGSLTVVLQSAVREYLHAAKSGEAIAVMGGIARGLVAASEQDGKDKGKFPLSAPPVPKTTPKGTTYASTAADWGHPSWKAIHFQLQEPQRFRYEFVTAPDRKHATIKAYGDVDGVGRDQIFELPIELGADGRPKLGDLKVTEAPAKK